MEASVKPGQAYGRLTAQWPCGRTGTSKAVVWLCLCACGKLSYVTSSNLARTKSCGCLYRNPIPKQDRVLWADYHITPAQYDEMAAAQDYACAVCGGISVGPGGAWRDLCIDHDHTCCPGSKSCGKCVRGLLCDTCNLLLGQANDDLGILTAAANYLRAWQWLKKKR